MYLFLSVIIMLFIKKSLSMCKPNNHFIKSPKCTDCVFFEPFYVKTNEFRYVLSKCKKFSKMEILYNNNIYYEYADVCRKEEDLCGKDGKYFIKNPNNDYK